jgi:hypothetical protein
MQLIVGMTASGSPRSLGWRPPCTKPLDGALRTTLTSSASALR